MYLYIGRVGSGYRWALWHGGRHAYLYERSRSTRWRTKYLGKVQVSLLPRRVVLAALRALLDAARRARELVEAAVAAAMRVPAFKRFVKEYREELEELGIADLEDGG